MLAARVAARYLQAKALKLGPGRTDRSATESLRKAKLRARSRGDLQGAILSAAYYAKKQKKPMYVYAGNSFGWGVWRATYKSSEYLDPINNTGNRVIEVAPDLTVTMHDVVR